DHFNKSKNNTIYVSNLPKMADEKTLKTVFSKFGKIREAILIKDIVTKESKRFGFVAFEKIDSAEKVMSQIDNFEIDGCFINVSYARSAYEPKKDPKKRNEKEFLNGNRTPSKNEVFERNPKSNRFYKKERIGRDHKKFYKRSRSRDNYFSAKKI
ncbi:hypothetical protein MHBO_003084, partial [Bonamia ostreae]